MTLRLFNAPRFFNPAPNVIIVYNNHPWMVHDGTLAKHSRYFYKMFRNEWKAPYFIDSF